jgi:hypothetical protein
MTQLEKAYVVEISDDPQPRELSAHFPVQFNPTSLKLTISAGVTGSTSGSQTRQSIGSANTTLTLELVFDTADEGTTDRPRSVREKTSEIERFVLPKAQDQKPPRIRFHWGSLVIDGVVDSLTVDLDLFAVDGTPLRAKVGLSIKEQNSKFIFLKAGPGANQKGDAPSPLAAVAGSLGVSAGLGVAAGLGVSAGVGISAGVNARFGAALGGESLPEFSARLGLDPTAWRGLSTDIAGGLQGDLSLQAGAEIGFSAGMTTAGGLGVTLGAKAGVSASLEASLGLAPDPSLAVVAGVGAGAELSAGFLLSASGGVSAALETARIVTIQAAEQQTRQAFRAPPAGAATESTIFARRATPPKPAPPPQSRPLLSVTGIPTLSQQLSAPPAPALPRADPRARSFGFGVPLRPSFVEAVALRTDSPAGGGAVRRRQADGLPPSSQDPTTPSWVALPNGDLARKAADRLQGERRSLRRCGCIGACGHQGGR